jgi:hypothetical protein
MAPDDLAIQGTRPNSNAPFVGAWSLGLVFSIKLEALARPLALVR